MPKKPPHPRMSLFAEEEKETQIRSIEEQIKVHEKSIDFFITDFTIEILVRKLETGDYFIPPYQRKNIWEPHRKSKFIESILIGLPIPFLFFWQEPNTGNKEGGEGAQRLTSLKEFINNELKITKLEKLTEINDLTFADLLTSRQKIFLNKPIRGVVLSSKTDKEARLDLFERLNTGSKNASPAEVRRGLLQGPFYSMIEELSKDPTFNDLAKISKQMQDMAEREEFITRFFAYGEDLENYNADVRKFIFNYTDKMNQQFAENPKLQQRYEDRFHKIMGFFKDKYPIGFKKDGKGQSSRTRFEGMAISTLIAERQYPGILNLITVQDCIDVFDSKDFSDTTGSDGANANKKLSARLSFAKDKFVEKYSDAVS